MKGFSVRLNDFVSLAPALATVLLLVVLPQVLSRDRPAGASAAAYVTRVQWAVERTSYRVGDWVGEDVPVPAAEVEMLRPSAILSRRFRNIGDDRVVTLVVVHCRDARDMGTHYPPRCYPARGWSSIAVEDHTDVLVPFGDYIVPFRIYDFVRGAEGSSRQTLRVLNCFVQSDGLVTADRPDVNYLLERREGSARGIAQIQLVTSGRLDLKGVLNATSQLLAGQPELIDVLFSKRGVVR